MREFSPATGEFLSDTPDGVYEELRRIAAFRLGQVAEAITLDPTDLVHESLIRLHTQRSMASATPGHQLAIAAIMIRRVLSNHLRSRRAIKRDANRTRVTCADSQIRSRGPSAAEVIQLRDALIRLGRLDRKQLAVVQLRMFGGLTVRQTAQHLSVSERTVEAHWHHARLWLARELRND